MRLLEHALDGPDCYRARMHIPRDPARFRSLLSKIMKDADLGQQDVATLAGISRPQVSRWLSGDHRPGFDALQRFTGALQVSYPQVAGNAAELMQAAGYVSAPTETVARAETTRIYPPEALERYGHALELRRRHLKYPYGKLRKFVSDRKPEISYRTASRLENGEPHAYPLSTLASADDLYELAPGASVRYLDALVAGADPELEVADRRGPDGEPPRYADPDLQAIWEMTNLDENVRLGIIIHFLGEKAEREARLAHNPPEPELEEAENGDEPVRAG